MAGSSRQLPVTFPHPTVEVFAALFHAGWVPGPPGPGIGGRSAFSLPGVQAFGPSGVQAGTPNSPDSKRLKARTPERPPRAYILGRLTVNSAPVGSALAAVMAPEWASTIRL